MNPIQLAEKIRAVIADYDRNTAMTALEIAKLLVTHRELAVDSFTAAIISGDSQS